MSLTTLKKELQKLDKAQLIELINELYKKHPVVKEHLDYFAEPDEKALFEQQKEKVRLAFFPKRGYNCKLMDGKKAISDFKKLGSSTELLADLMLYYVEMGVECLRGGDMGESFCSSVEGMYIKTLALMGKEKLLPKFQKRAAKVLHDSRKTGWGFHDVISQTYSEWY